MRIGGSGANLTGANIEHAGAHNQRVVLHTIRVHGPLTKADIARRTGLTHPTVTTIANRLLASGLLDTAGQRRGGRGQPATRLAINPRGAHAIGLNIDRDHITMVLVDFGGSVRAQVTQEIAFAMPAQVEAFYRREIDRLIQGAGVAPGAISGIGVARPDDLGEGSLRGQPARYGQWSTTRIDDLLDGALDVPVFVENDAAAAAIGEMQFGRGQRHGTFFYILVTYALGGGLVVHGMYDRGADGRSGEIGYLMVDDGAGERTQLQSTVSLAGLSQRMAAAGLADGGLRALDLADAPRMRVIEDWIDVSARAFVEPLIAINCLINPEAILIGGRLPIAILDRLVHRTNQRLRMLGRNAPVLAPVQAAALAEDAAAVGAALLPFGDLLMPASTLAPRASAASRGIDAPMG